MLIADYKRPVRYESPAFTEADHSVVSISIATAALCFVLTELVLILVIDTHTLHESAHYLGENLSDWYQALRKRYYVT